MPGREDEDTLKLVSTALSFSGAGSVIADCLISSRNEAMEDSPKNSSRVSDGPPRRSDVIPIAVIPLCLELEGDFEPRGRELRLPLLEDAVPVISVCRLFLALSLL